MMRDPVSGQVSSFQNQNEDERETPLFRLPCWLCAINRNLHFDALGNTQKMDVTPDTVEPQIKASLE